MSSMSRRMAVRISRGLDGTPQGGRKGGVVPDQLLKALKKANIITPSTENRAVGFAAAKRHFNRPNWRNFFGRAEMKALRTVTGTKRPTTAAALVVSRSGAAKVKLCHVSSAVLTLSHS